MKFSQIVHAVHWCHIERDFNSNVFNHHAEFLTLVVFEIEQQKHRPLHLNKYPQFARNKCFSRLLFNPISLNMCCLLETRNCCVNKKKKTREVTTSTHIDLILFCLFNQSRCFVDYEQAIQGMPMNGGVNEYFATCRR